MLLRRVFPTLAATLLGGWLVAAAGPALADPCHYIPDRGPMPAELRKGATFSGPVRYVGDGDSLCLGYSSEPRLWVEVRLADFYAPELHTPGGKAAQAALDRLVRNQLAVCTAGRRSFDRVIAVCRVNGASIGELMRRAGITEGGRGRTAAPNRLTRINRRHFGRIAPKLDKAFRGLTPATTGNLNRAGRL